MYKKTEIKPGKFNIGATIFGIIEKGRKSLFRPSRFISLFAALSSALHVDQNGALGALDLHEVVAPAECRALLQRCKSLVRKQIIQSQSLQYALISHYRSPFPDCRSD
ncbi:hypothetical protein [Cohnella cholangitidis]|uniref:hypothetical protein n=1 Tax=Cohnella cholangitidis TaxID=2598458 RepID=UPI0015FB052B|nr:hypothetical protein [Cohnella cholangitidis]